MKRFNLIAASFIFTAVFAMSAFAQASGAPQAAGNGRIGLVNTSAFLDDKPGAGITKFKNAVNSVEAEFKTVNDELQKMGQDYQTRVDAFNKKKGATGVPGGDLTADATAISDLETNIKRKQEDAKAKYERRYAQVVGPIYTDIIKAMNDFAKAKGYAVLLDGGRLEDAQILLGFDDKYDVTTEFIPFYNSRPGAATATTAAPKQ